MHRAGTHLLGLINQVLDLSKIEAGKPQLNPQTVERLNLLSNACKFTKEGSQVPNIGIPSPTVSLPR